MENFLKDIESLFDREINKNGEWTIKNIYLFGSRSYGIENKDSDYDFLVVVEGKYFRGPKLVEEGLLNINAYHKDFFQFLISENIVWFEKFTFYMHNFSIDIKDFGFLFLSQRVDIERRNQTGISKEKDSNLIFR